MADFSFDGLAGKLAGVAGALVSMRFLQGSFMERLTLAAGGAALSYYAGPHVSIKTGLPLGLAGFLIGMFGMAVLSKVWEWIQTTPVAVVWQIVTDWFKKRPGA
jgi:hypothetical protein